MLSRKAERRLGMGGVTRERVGKGLTKESERSQGSSEHRKEDEAEEMEIPVPGQRDAVTLLGKTGGSQRHCQVSGQRVIGDCLERQSEVVGKELDRKRKKIQEEFEGGLREIALREERELREYGILRIEWEKLYLGVSRLKRTEELDAESKEGFELRIKSCEEMVKENAKKGRFILGIRRDARLNALLKEYSFLGLCKAGVFFPEIVSAEKQSSYEGSNNRAYSGFEASGKEEDFVVGSQTNDLARPVPENESSDSGEKVTETEVIQVPKTIENVDKIRDKLTNGSDRSESGEQKCKIQKFELITPRKEDDVDSFEDNQVIKKDNNPENIKETSVQISTELIVEKHDVKSFKGSELERENEKYTDGCIMSVSRKDKGSTLRFHQSGDPNIFITAGEVQRYAGFVMIHYPLHSGKEEKSVRERFLRQKDNCFGNVMHFRSSDDKFLSRSRCFVRIWKDQRHFRIVVEWLKQSGLVVKGKMRQWRQKTIPDTNQRNSCY